MKNYRKVGVDTHILGKNRKIYEKTDPCLSHVGRQLPTISVNVTLYDEILLKYCSKGHT